MLDGQAGASAVPHAAELIEFGEAVLGEDITRLDAARKALHLAMGPAALADAAAIVASFNAVVKIADGTGIPLEDFKAAATADLREALGLDRLDPGRRQTGPS